MTRNQVPDIDWRGLGWELNQTYYMGHLASPQTYGHTGFTGTSLLVDPRRELVVVLLTNRVHPTRDGPNMNATRQAVADAAMAAADAARVASATVVPPTPVVLAGADVLLRDCLPRGDGAYRHRQCRRNRVPRADRLREVVAGVQEDHVDTGLHAGGKMDDHRVAHRRGDADPVTEGVRRPPDDVLGGCLGQGVLRFRDQPLHTDAILQALSFLRVSGTYPVLPGLNGPHRMTPVPP